MNDDIKELDARIGIPVDFAKKATDEANAKAKEEFDNVNHPSHYVSHPSGVETINITREFEFALGNAWKYLMRFRYKGKPKEDLEKAVWYMTDYVYHRDLYAEFSVKLGNEKTEYLINNARKVIAAEKIPEVKHAMRAILEQALFGRNVVCDFIRAKVELEDQVEKIATSLILGDEFDVASANTMIAADELLQRISEVETGEKLRAEAAKKAEETADKAETLVKNDIADIDADRVVQVWVDDITKEVSGFWQPAFGLSDRGIGHTESVEIPKDIYALGIEAARDYALKLVDERYAPYREKVPAEAPAETKPKKRRRRKKTEE